MFQGSSTRGNLGRLAARRALHGAIERASEVLAEKGTPPIPKGTTFHSLRRTYAASRAELGEHPAVTAAQMGHRDRRMTPRIYTDVTAVGRKLGSLRLIAKLSWEHWIWSEAPKQ